MKVVFLTNGPSRKVKVGKQEIILKRTTPRNMAAAGRTSGLVIQALRYLGKVHATRDRVKHLRALLSAKDRKQLLRDLRLAPAWTHPLLRSSRRMMSTYESVRSIVFGRARALPAGGRREAWRIADDCREGLLGLPDAGMAFSESRIRPASCVQGRNVAIKSVWCDTTIPGRHRFSRFSRCG
jgi:hypothetical protein